jgi:hypothetical protein
MDKIEKMETEFVKLFNDNVDCLVEIIQGVEGMCVTINDVRIAGSKPWGGGKVIFSKKTNPKNILTAMASLTKD